MSIHQLPSETLCSVFSSVNSQDVSRLRTVCHMFNDVIKRNYCFLPRVAYLVKVYSENGQIMIANMKSGDSVGCTQNLFEFDFMHWREIGIVEMEFVNIQETDLDNVCLSSALQLILTQLVRTRQSQLRKVVFNNVVISDKHHKEVEALFTIALNQCENVVVENCSLPIEFNSEKLNKAKFDHFRWVSSTGSIPTDNILRKLQSDMKIAVNKRSFLAEMDTVSVEAACDFLEEWLRLPIASFFNLSFHNCDDTWKTRFFLECGRRQLTHNYMEFQSKTHANAHVKVSFSQDATTCCIWPVLDVPARTTGQSVCYARYFRDF